MFCRCVNDFKLTVSAFSLEGWKKWWSDEWVDGFVGWFGIGRDGFANGGPHAASASRADGNVGVLVLGGEGEKWANLYAVNVENMLSAW